MNNSKSKIKFLLCPKFNFGFSRGFTLIETLISIAVLVFAFGSVVMFVLTLYKAQDYGFEQAIAISEARKGIETMVKEIREARTGADGSYIIEKADDYEFIFYSDIDKDNEIERVRYFIGGSSTNSQNNECVTFDDGGSCFVNFSNFLQGSFQSAQVTVSVEGDFGSGNEYADITADSVFLGDVCKSGCNDCAGAWQGSATFDVTNQASDDSISISADSTSRVNDFCDWIDPNHAMKAKFDFSWTESVSGDENNFRKGVIEPTGFPPVYLKENEEVAILSRYVRNTSPIFKYFDKNGNEITQTPARPEETSLMRVNLLVNVNPNESPKDFELESDAQIRNLKTNL